MRRLALAVAPGGSGTLIVAQRSVATHGLDAVRRASDEGRRALPAAAGMDLGPVERVGLAAVDAADATGIEHEVE